MTGGASAAYGSGAISGVVNILLKTTLRGREARCRLRHDGQGDGDNYHVGIGGRLGKFGGDAATSSSAANTRNRT